MARSMPSFDKAPAALVARFDQLAALVPDATRRPMFGYPSCTLGGHMFMSLFQDSLVLRLNDSDRTEMMARHGATEFAPMAGRVMTGYVAVPASFAAGKEIEGWVRRARDAAAALPPKAPKGKR